MGQVRRPNTPRIDSLRRNLGKEDRASAYPGGGKIKFSGGSRRLVQDSA